MKKIYQLIIFCCLAITGFASNESLNNLNGSTFLDSLCSVDLSIDSTNTGDVILVANPTGTAPFAYQWSTNENTSSIVVTNWGVNYCVTVTDATGCETSTCLFSQNNCAVYIMEDPSGELGAIGTGVGAFSFIWSTGSSSSFIQPTTPGNYCVTMTDGTGCESVACYWWGNNPDPCTVNVVVDTVNTGTYFTAMPNGTAPFTFSWSTGDNTQSIPLNPAYFGPYCVTVTDATGCIAMNCAFFNPCDVYIVEGDSAGFNILQVLPNNSGFTYQWSNGETGQYIVVTDPGTYCVTATGNGCVGNACYNYTWPTNYNISGYLYFPDSLNSPGPMQGIVELFYNAPNSNDWEPMGTTNIQSDPSGWSNYYSFGIQTNAGNYILKATLDPNSPGAADYMPTYHLSTVHWDEADLITLPSNGSGLFNIILNDGQNFAGGQGNINGTVTEGDGLTANEGDERSGDPLPNVSVLLFDNNEAAVTHTKTDDAGKYSFTGLPMGTYQVMVEIVGKEQVGRWVTLTTDNPTSNGNDFEVTETGIVLGLDELVNGNASLSVFPNPTTGDINLNLEAATNFEAQIQVSRLDGKMVFAQQQQLAKGKQSIQLPTERLPSGLYLLQVTTNSGVATAKFVKQ